MIFQKSSHCLISFLCYISRCWGIFFGRNIEIFYSSIRKYTMGWGLNWYLDVLSIYYTLYKTIWGTQEILHFSLHPLHSVMYCVSIASHCSPKNIMQIYDKRNWEDSMGNNEKISLEKARKSWNKPIQMMVLSSPCAEQSIKNSEWFSTLELKFQKIETNKTKQKLKLENNAGSSRRFLLIWWRVSEFT